MEEVKAGALKLTPMEIDAIGEVMNISMGSAATAVSTMLEKTTVITTPSVQVATLGEVDNRRLEPAILVRITYTEGVTGSNVMVFRQRDLQLILNCLMGIDEPPADDFVFDDLSMSAACEVMNQMMGASATALSDFLGISVNISTPTANIMINDDTFHETVALPLDSEVVLITFNLSIKDMMNSEFVSVLSVDFAKAIVSRFLMQSGLSEGAEDAGSDVGMASGGEAPAAEPMAAVPPPVAAMPTAAPVPTVSAAPPVPMTDVSGAMPPVAPPVAPPMAPPAIGAAAPPIAAAQPAAPPPMPAVPAPGGEAAGAMMAMPQGYPMAGFAGAENAMGYPGYGMGAPGAMPSYGCPPYGYPGMYGSGMMGAGHVVKNVQFPEFSQVSGQKEEPVMGNNMDLIMNVPLDVSIEIGATKRRIKEIMDFSQGTVIELDKQAGAPVDIVVNGQLIAHGDVVVIDDNFGVRITEIVGTKELVSALSGDPKK